MHSNKYHGKLNLKYKENNPLQSCKNTPHVPSQTPKQTLNRIEKPQSDFKTPFGGSQRSIKLHNCLTTEGVTPVCRIPRPRLKRKSSSLTELTCCKKGFTPIKWQSKEHGDEVEITNTPRRKVEISLLSGSKESELARKACKMFVLHAWRQRRSQVLDLQTQVKLTKNKLQDLNIQVIVLKELLEREMSNVSVTTSESAQLKKQLENEIKVTKGLKEDLQQYESEKTIWENTRAQMASEIKVLDGKLSTANDKLNMLKEECVGYERDLSFAREKEARLIAKIGVTETCLRDKTTKLDDSRKTFADVEKQMVELVSSNQKLRKENETKDMITFLNDLLKTQSTIETETPLKILHALKKLISEASAKMKQLEGELNNLQNIRKVQDENIFNLKKDFAAATKELEEKESAINLLENTVNEYESEKEEFEQTLKKARNQVVFEAIKMSAGLLFPNPLH